MKLLLTAINAKYIHSNLAVYSLRASAGSIRDQVKLAEFTINHRTEEILRDIYRKKPDVLFFSCYIWNMVYVTELTAECKKVMPGVPIWLGGPEVSYDAEQYLREHPEVDGILCGEGEESFRRLGECYVNREADVEHLLQIPGLVFRRNLTPQKKNEETVPSFTEHPNKSYVNYEAGAWEVEQIQTNPPAPLVDLSTLPFPYQELTDFENRIIYYESSRGCPFSCSYCLSSIDKSVRFRSLELVLPELQFFLDRKVPQVKFVDRTFNCRKSHAMLIWRYLLDHDNGVTNFHFEIAADLLDEDELALIARMRPGLIQLEIGVQSTNPRTLEAICRKTDLDGLRAVVAKVHAGKNIHQHLDLIAGLPFEDYESFGRSFNDVYAMRPDQLQLGFLKVLKGSRMHREAEQYGIVRRALPPYEVLCTPWLPFSDVLRLKMVEEMVENYYNSHQFDETLDALVSRFPSPFAFFEQLAEFYEERHAEQRKHSRVQRYELLLAFAQKSFPEEEQSFRQLLTIDYYLRERAKARPSFAPDQAAYKEQLSEILRQTGKQNHVEAVPAGDGQVKYLVFDYENRDPLTHAARVIEYKE